MSARNGVRARKNKERSKNFTELEKRTVLELISQHREVLRQGRSNNATNKSKQLVWSQICTEVNKRCRSECPRTPAQVKMWYENYKKKCKMRRLEPGTEDTSVNIEGMIWQNLNPLSQTLIKDEIIPSTNVEISDDHLPINMSSDHLDDRGIRDVDSKEAITLIIPKERPPLSISRSPGTPSPIIKPDSPSLLIPEIRSITMPIMPAHTNFQQIVHEPISNVPLNLSHLESNVLMDDSSQQDEPREASPDYSNYKYVQRPMLPSSQIYPNKKHPKPRGYYARAGNSQENGCCDRLNNPDTTLPQNSHGNGNNHGNYFCSNASPTEEEKLYYLTKRQHAINEHELKMKLLNMELRHKDEVFSLQKQLFLIELKVKMDYLEKNSNQ